MNNQKPDTIDNVQIEVTTDDQNQDRPRGLKKFNQDMGKVGQGLGKTGKAVGSVAQDFINFLKRGNVVDLAVGVVMGAAFTAIVNSLVNDIITPIIGLATEKNLENTFVVIKCKVVNGTKDPNCIEGKQGNYSTVTAANAAGALTLNWGRFIQTVINFLIISAFIYFFVKIYGATFLRVAPKPPVKSKACQFCFEDIKLTATRCKHCTAEQIPKEEEPGAAPSSSANPLAVFSNIKNPFAGNGNAERKKQY